MPPKKASLQYAIGIDLGGTNVRAGVVSSRGGVLHSLKSPIPKKRTRQTLIQQVQTLVQELLLWSQKNKIKVKGIGFGCPGILSMEKGIVQQSPNLPEWNNLRLSDFFRKRFHLPFVLENDANAAALGEAWVGAGKKADIAICVTLGTGVGGGIVLNQHLWHGRNGGGGEVGHIVVRDQGKKCGCGNFGCLEQYASATAIVNHAKELLKTNHTRSSLKKLPKLTSQGIFAAARKGDKLALKVTRNAATILGAGLTSLIHIFNPEVIIIGGGVSENGNLLFGPLRREVKRRCFPQMTRRLKIIPAQLGDHAGMIGAARALFLFESEKKIF